MGGKPAGGNAAMIDTTKMTFGEIIERLIDAKLAIGYEREHLHLRKLESEIVQLTVALDRYNPRKRG